MPGKPNYLYEARAAHADPLEDQKTFLLQFETTGDIDISVNLDRKTLEAFRDQIAFVLSERTRP